MRRFVARKYNSKRDYEYGDRKPEPSPDILLSGESQGLRDSKVLTRFATLLNIRMVLKA